jgi:hypothetical protein
VVNGALTLTALGAGFLAPAKRRRRKGILTATGNRYAMSLGEIYLTAVGGAFTIFLVVLLRRFVWLAVVPPIVVFFVYILVHNFRLHP